MDEYIKRDGVLSKFNIDDMMNVNGTLISLQDARETISNFPAVDVAPVVHGRWISLAECANEGVYCSICKKKVWKSDYVWCNGKRRNKFRSNYCPNCGAKMDRGDNSATD